jgi:hypothetical protein
MLWKRLLGKGVSHTNSGRELEELDLELLGLWPTMRLILALLEVNDSGLRTQESQSTTCLYLAIAPRATPHSCTYSTNVHTSTYTHTSATCMPLHNPQLFLPLSLPLLPMTSHPWHLTPPLAAQSISTLHFSNSLPFCAVVIPLYAVTAAHSITCSGLRCKLYGTL